MSKPAPLTAARRACRPEPGDTLETIAARELPGVAEDEAVASLRTWNPHLNRRGRSALLVSDVIFLEAPPASQTVPTIRGF